MRSACGLLSRRANVIETSRASVTVRNNHALSWRPRRCRMRREIVKALMALLYRSAERGDYNAIRELLIAVGWERRVADVARFEQMMAGATRTAVALDGDRLVGFGRALTDGASNGYISTLAVARDYRRLGIGRALVTQ